MASLADVAAAAGVSIKTASGALHGGNARMAKDTRQRVISVAADLGYVVDMAARGTRTGVLPIVGMIADGLITSPFATEIMRVFDNSLKGSGLSVLVSNLRRSDLVDEEVAGLNRFKPQAIVYASMFHKLVPLSASAAGTIQLMVNCQSTVSSQPALVPDETAAAVAITELMLETGRRNIAFLNLPGLLAGELRLQGFLAAHLGRGLSVAEGRVRMAVDASVYHDRARSLVGRQLQDWFSGADRPDAILCGNDRVAFEVYNCLRRLGLSIPADVAVGSFDNQVDIAARLDPPLTAMALPHRAMARAAANIVLGRQERPDGVIKFPFTLVRRASL